MQDQKRPAATSSWSVAELPKAEINDKLLNKLSEIGASIGNESSRKLSQALDWAGVTLPEYKMVDRHPSLPEWWSERKNKLFIPADIDGAVLPSIHPHPGIPLPENCTIFLNNTADYSILLWGSESLLYVAPNVSIPSAYLALGDGFVFIGPDVRSTARLNINCRNGGSIVLTSDILIGSDVKFQSDDCHTIILLSSGARINPFGGTIIVKKHVWFGEGALVLGDTHISENCVVGARSFMRGISTPPNSILAGIPAKVTRSDITWDSRDLPPDHPELAPGTYT